MTLLELLVKELPKRGGWPDSRYFDVEVIAQDFNGKIWGYPRKPSYLGEKWGVISREGYFCFKEDLCIDYQNEDGLVNRKQYESALAASQQPVWNGDGLPPVGEIIEVNSPRNGWTSANVVAVTDTWLIAKYDDGVEFSGCHRQMERDGSWTNNLDHFRPIRTEAERKREETIASIQQYIIHADNLTAESLYAMIESRKITGVKLGK